MQVGIQYSKNIKWISSTQNDSICMFEKEWDEVYSTVCVRLCRLLLLSGLK